MLLLERDQLSHYKKSQIYNKIIIKIIKSRISLIYDEIDIMNLGLGYKDIINIR